MLMNIFADLSQFAMPAAIIGGILFVLGFYLKGNAKKDTASSLFSMLFLTVGVILLLFAASVWISQSFSSWNFFSDRMI